MGDGREFARIEDAVAAAKPNDRIEVYPKAGGYPKTAVLIRTPGLTIKGLETDGKTAVLDGTGFDYSGVGRTPRAIFQVDPGADGVTIQGFELKGAHNASHNGAGVRINAANGVRVIGCDIHGNDMGVMSNGRQGDPQACRDQLFLSCRIYENGDRSDPGYSHNLYLGGTSVTLDNCEVFRSLTGHNVKSRAHFTLVRNCFIHDSANRELDFVEAWDTERPHSNAVILDSILAKDPNCIGNRGVIHFGKEKGQRDGTVFLINSTVVTTFLSSVLDLSDPSGRAVFTNDVILNAEQTGPTLVGVLNGASLANVTGSSNWISSAYSLAGTRIDSLTRYQGQDRRDNLGIGPPKFLLAKQDPFWKPAKRTYVDGLGARQEVSDQSPQIGGVGIRKRL